MPKVTVFSTTYCGVCKQLKQWLDNKGVAYDDVNLDQDPARTQEVITKSGSMQVPITLIENENGDQRYIVGSKYSEISSALGI